MASFFARLAAVTMFSVFALSSINAQERTVELGIDAGLSVISADGNSVTTLNVPVPAFRVGFFVSDRLSLEPSLLLAYATTSNVSSTSYNLIFGALYHLSTDRTRPQLFLRPLIGYGGSRVSGTSGLADNTNGSALVGIGIGAKVPKGDRFALRFGADYERRFEDDPSPAFNRFAATVGFSFFTR